MAAQYQISTERREELRKDVDELKKQLNKKVDELTEGLLKVGVDGCDAVSYTHLTLPTILLV